MDLLPPPEVDEHSQADAGAVALPGHDAALPLRVRAEINAWGKNMYQAAADFPFRILETILDVQGNIKKVAVDLAANLLSEFLERNGVPMEYEQAFSFAQFMLQGILKQVKKDVEKYQLDTVQADQDRP